MIILLSPSKTQNFDDAIPKAAHTQPALLDESQLLMKKLKTLSAKKIATLMDVSDKIATLNHRRFQSFALPFTTKNARQAAFAFRGDVYDGLDALHLSLKTMEFAQAHIRILSGLYGLLRPLDLIQPYRLEMSIRLTNQRGRDLYKFWGNRIAEEINKASPNVVINLASGEYFKALPAKSLIAPVITPQFKEKKNDGYQMIGLFAKKARGLMARYIAIHNLTSAEDLLSFREEGYQLNTSLSKPGSPVFTRDR